MKLTAAETDHVSLHSESNALQTQVDALDQAPCGWLRLRDDGLILGINTTLASLLGKTRTELVGQRFDSILPLASRVFYQTHLLAQLTLHGKLEEIYFSLRTCTGAELPVLLNARRNNFDGQKVNDFVFFVARRRNDYENEILKSKRAAEEATMAKGQFLANMSHEIRTPMNAILGMLALLRSTPLTPRQLDYTTKTQGAAKSLLGLLNDILDFSKVDAGKITLDPQPFGLDRLLADLSVIVASNVGSKDVELLLDVDPELPAFLTGDAMRLQQVLINLTGNAIKFTEQGEVRIKLKLAALNAKRALVDFAVSDSGIGIAPDKQSHVFSGFSQAEASTSRRFGGTGLGLAICKRLIELMGGDLKLQSALGQGSTFYFSLEFPVAPIPAGFPANEAMEKRVLLVESRPASRALLLQQAHALGWQANVFEDASQAIKGLDATLHQPVAHDGVLLDWRQTNGEQAWQEILNLCNDIKRSTTPILLMVSAQDREALALRNEAEQSPIHGFLVKPFTALMLRKALADATATLLQPSATMDQQPAQSRLHGLRILVVEDNIINQQIAQELLSAEGALVQLAQDGQQGVDAVAQALLPFDAVLMDVQMPVMDGFEATRAIRQDLDNADLPVIAMTANAMASDKDACLAAGMNDHIGKPFDLNHLVQVLLRYTRRTGLDRRASKYPTQS